MASAGGWRLEASSRERRRRACRRRLTRRRARRASCRRRRRCGTRGGAWTSSSACTDCWRVYLAAAAAARAFDKTSVNDYTEAILGWWRAADCSAFPAWALAARIVFAISPNSASCERVFALLRNLFGEAQMSSLADYIQGALMLNYNKREVG